jgi:hypothetical protein
VVDFLMVLNIWTKVTRKKFYISENQTSQRAMIILIFTVIAVISSTVQGSLQITEHEYTLMHYTKLMSVEHFTAGRPLVILLPLAEDDSTNKEVGYLIDEIHTSGRWPILLFNVSYKMNENMYTPTR